MGVNIHEIGAALSNDGINFGPAATIYIYDSTCVNFSKIQGSVSFAIKVNINYVYSYMLFNMQFSRDQYFSWNPLMRIISNDSTQVPASA
jgi:hypothetical protein